MIQLWPYECGECGETFESAAELADPSEHTHDLNASGSTHSAEVEGMLT